MAPTPSKPNNAAPVSPADQRYAEVRKVTLIGAVADLLLGVAKIAVGYIGASQALIADGIHSLSDLVTDFGVLFAAKHASREADEEHPYGHGRIETVMTVMLGLALIAVALGIGWDAGRRLFSPDTLLQPGWMALWVAVASILVKEAIYHYTMRAARKLRSNLLRANAWHSRSDAISSVIVVIGVLGAIGGLAYLDALAAIGVAAMIAKIGWDLGWHSLRELIDEGLDAERVESIRETILSVDGVQSMHMLRTRRMGADALVDVHVLLSDPHASVSEGHQLSETVRARLIEKIDEVSDVMVHIDPEDDQEATPCCSLPSREHILGDLRASWADIPEAAHPESVVLHYLDGKIEADVTLGLEAIQADIGRGRDLAERMRRAALARAYIRTVRVAYS